MSTLFASTEMLIEQYELKMRMDTSRSSALTSLLSPINALLDITNGIENALNENPVVKASERKPMSNTSSSPQETALGDKNTCEEEEIEEEIIPPLEWGVEGSEQTTYLDMGELFDKETAQNIEECWSCDLRAEYDWEIKPVNFLAEIDELMNDIENAIDHAIDVTKPHNLIEELCPLFNMDSEFSWMCAPDLMAMMQGIQLVLARYLNESLNFTLNWTAVIGPLIKFIADNLSMCMENIRNIILAPINCINAVLKTASQIQDEFNELAGTLGTAASAVADPTKQSFYNLFEKGNYSADRKIGWDNPESAEEYFLGSGGLGATSSLERGSLNSGLSFNYNANLDDLLQKNKSKTSGGLFKLAGESAFPSQEWAPNAIVPSLKEAGGWIGDTDKFLRTDSKGNPVNLLQKMILTLNSAESIINNLFANLIFTIKSLNKLVVGNLSMNIKISGMILFLIDLWNLGKIWKEVIDTQGIEGFKNLCKQLEDGEGDLYDRMMHPFFAEDKASSNENRNNDSIGTSDSDNDCGITEE